MSEAAPFLTRNARRTSVFDDHDPSGESAASGNAFASVKGLNAARSLEFIRKDRSSFAVPYAYLPVCWWRPPGCLLVEYPGLFTVALHGHGLEELKSRLADQRLLWVRECEARDAASLAAAVTRIAILRSYPSRDGDVSDGDHS